MIQLPFYLVGKMGYRVPGQTSLVPGLAQCQAERRPPGAFPGPGEGMPAEAKGGQTVSAAIDQVLLDAVEAGVVPNVAAIVADRNGVI